MDDHASPPSPTSSSASDSDAYNTESARLYFGPLKTPERNFVASTKKLFPPALNTPPRRSPRLSSPRPRSSTPADLQIAEEEREDIEQVAQLVNEAEEGEELESGSNSMPGTPLNGEVFPDEPSSALAERIIHAHGNPSPPPSPPAELSLFDPYHTDIPEFSTSTNYQADLMSLELDGQLGEDDANPVFNSTVNVQMDTQRLVDDSTTPQKELIYFDSLTTPLAQGNFPTQLVSSIPQPVLSVDDLLAKSPSPVKRPVSPQLDIPQVIVQLSENRISEVGSPMIVDEPLSMKADSQLISDQGEVSATHDLLGTPTDAASTVAPVITEEILPATPLRRSTRPRRSVTPNPPAVIPSTPIVTPSNARTQVKKRFTNSGPADEVVSDSQDEEEEVQRSRLSTTATPTTTSVRVRHRSPGKGPLSFSRELGSLSPESTSVLANLAFGSAFDGSNGAILPNISEDSGSQSAFSFSVFAPSGTTVPSTPVRSSGPIRFTSPTKAESSPNKFRLQTPAPNDPTNTPARRIPISQAITQGHVSPEKAAQLGYKPNDTSLGAVSTPARRVLISEASAPSTSKLNESRLGSPTKTLLLKRERSVEPTQRPVVSVKGKEKEEPSQVSSKTSTIMKKLPFPIISSASPSVVPSSPLRQVHSSETVNESSSSSLKVSPAKSSLKQVTSRIPRIGAKPYARVTAPTAATAAKTKPTTMRMVDLTKSTPKPSATDNPATTLKKEVGIAGVSKATASSAARIKPSASTSTSLLKRKRDAEKVSPAKPRVIMLRQVPLIPSTPAESSASAQPPLAPTPAQPSLTAKGKKPSQAPVRIRRVMDPVPPPRSIIPPTVEQEEPTIVYNPPKSEAKISEPSSEDHVHQTVEGSPGSPMKEDLPDTHTDSAPPQGSAEESSEPVLVPTVVIEDYSSVSNEDSSNGLRRTTRSRKVPIVHDVFTEGSTKRSTSRRKASAFRSDDTFSGMSMTALKDLTVSNTLRNQRYLTANLETEVIRKQGVRPESPAVKVRTIVQRQQEERDRQRAERAKRRARRSDEIAGSSDIEGSSDVGYSSLFDDQGSDGEQEMHSRHRRGAGDEEDYETPDRPEKQLKRTRLFVDNDMDVDDRQPKRRVKWDRGLFTTVCLDEVQLGTRQTLKENVSLKGILAPTAKALRLDTLGNLPQADSPLTDIVPENITVKKIVYDSDVPAVPEVAVVKNTRSKAKK